MARDWIALDWGTTHLRAWWMSDADITLAKQFDLGMQKIPSGGYADALHEVIGDFAGPVIACGMIGARQGWVEARYASVPCAPPGRDTAVSVDRLMILPGVSQSAPPDVMRGEETQIAGLLAQAPDFDGVACLPGTHTKWVHISAGEIVSFRTSMTGELFALLSGRSILRHSMQGDWDAAVFAEAVSDALSKPEILASALFEIRARDLVGDTPRHGTARLSGLLVGAELAAMKPYWLGRPVAIIGAQTLSKRYATALSAQGTEVLQYGGEDMAVAGLIAAFMGGALT